MFAAMLAACNQPENQTKSDTPPIDVPAETTEKVTYLNGVVYAASTDFYFENENGGELSVRVSNLPEEQTVKFPANLLESDSEIEGPPGANPDMVGKTFFIVRNEKGEVTEIRPAEAASEFQHGTILVGVVVTDFQKALDFYTNVLGMKKTGGFSIDEDFGKRSGLSNGVPFDVTILKLEDSPQATEWKLLSFGKKAAHPRPKYIQDDTGIQYVTIFVKSMKPFIERIKKHSVPFLGETPTTLGDGRQFVLVQDPDGTFIELIGPE